MLFDDSRIRTYLCLVDPVCLPKPRRRQVILSNFFLSVNYYACLKMDLLQPILNGLLLGGLYAVIGIGLSTMFGIVRLLNLAHGDLMILSAYLSMTLAAWFGLNPFLSLILVIPVMFFLGILIQKYLLNRVIGKELEPPMLVAFGLSFILQNFLLLVFTPDAQSLMTDLSLKTIPLGNSLNISVLYLVNFCVGCGVILGLYLFFSP